MAATLPIGAFNTQNPPFKGKKFHRRTKSTLELDLGGLTPKGIIHDEIVQEIQQTQEIVESEITQKILDVSIDLESEREVIVDDIDEVPNRGAIVPRLNFNNNPLAFPKRRNLSAITPALGNFCPIKKIDLFSNLKNIDDLTGLDTIYEKRHSIESFDGETLDTGFSSQHPEQSAKKAKRTTLRELKGNHSKHSSSDNQEANSRQRISVEGRKTHSRQSSADFAYYRLNQVAKDHNVRSIKPLHSKHSSIDFNKENFKQGSFDFYGDKVEIHKINYPLRPMHSQKCSLNISPSHTKQPSLTVQPTSACGASRNNSKRNRSKQTSGQHTKTDSQDKKSQATTARSKKKSIATNQKYFILPGKSNNVTLKSSTKNKSVMEERNKFMSELQKISLDQMKTPTTRTPLVTRIQGEKHEGITNIVTRDIPLMDRNEHFSYKYPNVIPKRTPNSHEKSTIKSISPIRNVSSRTPVLDSKQQTRPRPGKSDVKSFKEFFDSETVLKTENRLNLRDIMKTEFNCEISVPRFDNSMEKLMEKTAALEEQVTNILQTVSSVLNEEAQLKEKVRYQENQIKSLEAILAIYEQEVMGLRAGAVCKTDPSNHTKRHMRKDKSETRIMTTTDTSTYESLITENSGQVYSKTSRRKRKISPFAITLGGYNAQSTRHEPNKTNEFIPNEYINLMEVIF